MATNGANPEEQSLPELIRQLAQEGSTLLRQEVDLAKAELGQKVAQARDLAPGAVQLARKDLDLARRELAPKARRLGVGAGALAAAGIAGLVAAGMVAATATAALAVALPVWAAALIVTALFLLLAGGLATVGLGRVRGAMPLAPTAAIGAVRQDVETVKGRLREAVPPLPKQTIQTVKDDVEWIRSGMHAEPPASGKAPGEAEMELTGTPVNRGVSDDMRRWLEQRRRA
jgi:Putative Actinobacterial Holin-X, holin superfamily III